MRVCGCVSLTLQLLLLDDVRVILCRLGRRGQLHGHQRQKRDEEK